MKTDGKGVKYRFSPCEYAANHKHTRNDYMGTGRLGRHDDIRLQSPRRCVLLSAMARAPSHLSQVNAGPDAVRMEGAIQEEQLADLLHLRTQRR